MADKSKIEWTDATWNPITGCSLVSPGCKNCYAMKLAGGRLKHHPSRKGLTEPSKAGPVWTGEVRFNKEWLEQPLRWRRPRHIFVCAHGDLFHEAVPESWILKVFAVMARAPQHRFYVLTKRSDRMLDWVDRPGRARFIARAADVVDRHLAEARLGVERALRYIEGREPVPARWPLPNVILGVSVEDQQRANERIPLLLETPAAIRFLSVEPLLEPVTIFDLDGPIDLPDGMDSPLHQVIVGGESGSGARPMHPNWARSIRDQCANAGVPFFFKQWGAWCWIEDMNFEDAAKAAQGREYLHHSCGRTAVRVGKKRAGRMLDGRTWDGMPA